MKYHTDNVPSTIPSLHTWIRLRENLQFLADASVRGRKTIYCRYFSITYNRFSFGLNKYEIEQGQRERERERNSIEILGGGEEHGSKEGKNISRMLFNKIERLVSRSSPRAGTEKEAFIIGNDACDTGERIAGTVDYTGQTHKLHPMAFVLLSSIILALCTPPQETWD